MRRVPNWSTGGIVALAVLAAAACRDVSAPSAAACAQPVAVLGTYDPAAPDFIIQYRDGIDPVAETNRLAARYGFTAKFVYTAAFRGFAAALTPDVVANLQCEPSVALIEHDAVAHVD